MATGEATSPMAFNTLVSRFLKNKADILWFIYTINTVSWSFVLLNMISSFPKTGIIFPEVMRFSAIVAYVSAAVFIISGGFLYDFTSRYEVSLTWTFGGFFMTIFLTFMEISNLWQAIAIGVVLGFFASLCLPSILNHYLNLTTFENRGFISGISFSLIYMVIFLMSTLASAIYVFSLLVLASWRLVGLYSLAKYDQVRSTCEFQHGSKMSNSHNFLFLPSKNAVSFILMFLLFLVVDHVEQIIFIKSYSLTVYRAIVLVEFCIAIPFMIFGGRFMDNFGRRLTFAVSFASVSFAYVILSAAPYLWPIYAILDGIGWSLLTITFILVIWGDISTGISRNICIAICIASYSSIAGLRDLIAPFLPHFTSVQSLAFAIVFLFIAAVFIITAPETLPQEVLEKRKIKRYIRDALKVKEEFERRGF